MKTPSTALLLLTLLIGACASKRPEKKAIIYPDQSAEVSTTNPKETSVLAKQVATEQGSSFVSEVKFSKGKSTLSAFDRTLIRENYEKARAKGEIREAQLVTWGDKEFPTKGTKELDGTQRKLVDQRNDRLADFVSDLDSDIKVKKISMAERAGTMARFTQSEEAQVKNSLEAKDAPGKAGASMVIFLLK